MHTLEPLLIIGIKHIEVLGAGLMFGFAFADLGARVGKKI